MAAAAQNRGGSLSVHEVLCRWAPAYLAQFGPAMPSPPPPRGASPPPFPPRHALPPARGAASPADLPHPSAGRGAALLPQLRPPPLQLSLLQRPALSPVRRPGCPAVARGECGAVAAGELFPGHLHRAGGLAPLDSLSSPPGL